MLWYCLQAYFVIFNQRRLPVLVNAGQSADVAFIKPEALQEKKYFEDFIWL